MTDGGASSSNLSAAPSRATSQLALPRGRFVASTRATKARKQGKSVLSETGSARLLTTSQRYRKPRKIPQFFPRAAGSRRLKMRMGNQRFTSVALHAKRPARSVPAHRASSQPLPTIQKPKSGPKLGKSATQWLRRPTQSQKSVPRSQTAKKPTFAAKSL